MQGPGLDMKSKFMHHILMFLLEVYNLSNASNSIPPTWKHAQVTSIFKGGDPSYLNNKSITVQKYLKNEFLIN